MLVVVLSSKSLEESRLRSGRCKQRPLQGSPTHPCVSEGSSFCPNGAPRGQRLEPLATRAKAGAFAYARTRQNNAILIHNGRSRTRRIAGKTLGSRRRAKSLG